MNIILIKKSEKYYVERGKNDQKLKIKWMNENNYQNWKNMKIISINYILIYHFREKKVFSLFSKLCEKKIYIITLLKKKKLWFYKLLDD